MATKSTNNKKTTKSKKDTKKVEYPKLTSPDGKAKFAYLWKPDDYKGQEKHKVDLVVDPDDASDFKEEIDKLVDEAFDQFQDDDEIKASDKKKMVKAYPYYDEEDDDGNETGEIAFKFKSNPKDKKGTPRFSIFDAAGNRIKKAIWSGSTIAVQCLVRPYYFAGSKQAGVTLYINAVQLIEASDGGGAAPASSPFESREGGYVHDTDDDEEDDDEDTDEADDEEDDEEDDF